MPSRRYHPKSRLGCCQCKQARVKCDQARPVCSRCTKSGKWCQYVPAKPAIIATRTSTPDGTLPNEYDAESERSGTQSGLTASSSAPPSMFDFSEFDLQLMHHFTAATYATLWDKTQSSFKEVWQMNVPKEAFSQRFLLHSLLALAALHKTAQGADDNESRCLASAVKHHSLALAKSKPALASLSKENCDALFLLSASIVIFALALPVCDKRRRHIDPVSELAQIASLTRGSATIVKSGFHWVKEGKLGPLLREGFLSSTNDLPADVQCQLGYLEGLIDSAGFADDVKAPYIRAIELLTTCFRNTTPFPADSGVVLSWLAMIPSELIAFISEKQPMALVILAHYGVLMHGLKDVWWCQDWGSNLIESISLSLEGEWQDLVAWPKQRIGQDVAARMKQ